VPPDPRDSWYAPWLGQPVASRAPTRALSVFDPGSDRRSCSQFRPDESAASVVIGPVVEPRVGSIRSPRQANRDRPPPGPSPPLAMHTRPCGAGPSCVPGLREGGACGCLRTRAAAHGSHAFLDGVGGQLEQALTGEGVVLRVQRREQPPSRRARDHRRCPTGPPEWLGAIVGRRSLLLRHDRDRSWAGRRPIGRVRQAGDLSLGSRPRITGRYGRVAPPWLGGRDERDGARRRVGRCQGVRRLTYWLASLGVKACPNMGRKAFPALSRPM